MRIILAIVVALGMTACGDDSSSSSSNRPKPRKNSKKKKPKKAKKAAFSTYPKVEAGLRYGLQEIDFIPDATGRTNRDPFRSWVLTLGNDPDSEVIKMIDVCTESGNGVEWEAKGFSIRDLALIGIVKRGRSFAQFTDRGEVDSWIVRKGDCLGQEKAIVEEISVGVVRLVITPPTPAGRPAPPAQAQIISLHPEEREIDSSIVDTQTRDLR